MTAELPQTLAANPTISTWLTVRPDGSFDLRAGKVELGQGILTALTQIAAHELGVDPGRVRTAAANTRRSPDEGITAGSRSISSSGTSVRRVCAEARLLFRRAAARRVGVPEDDVQVIAGVFVGRDGVALASYGDLAAAVDLAVPAGDPTLDVELLAPTSKDLPRIDLPDKVFGRPRFIHDLSFDGMLHARVARPPRPGAHLLDAPDDSVSTMPGVRQVVRDHDFLAVIADREGQAVNAAEALSVRSTWSGGTPLPDESTLPRWLREQDSDTTVVREGLAQNRDVPNTLRASYSKPYVAHGSIGPSCAIALFNRGRLDIWSHSQGVFTLGAEIARSLELPAESVAVQHVEGAGSYGHNSADDAAFDAALLAIHHPGRHIRVQWSRADEFSWEPFGPAMVADMSATISSAGRLSDWSCELWSNGHTARPGYAPAHGLLADAHRAGVDRLPPSIDPPAARGWGSARNAEPYYDIPNVAVTSHRLLTMPIRTSSLRSLGSHLNTFAIESFMDELAHAVQMDPLALRLRHLSDSRARDVLTTAAAAGRWGDPSADGFGRGLGFCRYKNSGSYCAVVAEIEAAKTVRVIGLTIAVDVGRVVSNDGVRNQIEGGAIQSVSWTRWEKVSFNRESVTSTDWATYPILRFSEIPRIDVHVIARPDEPPLGAGEATQGPVPAAIGNAIYDAIGVRMRAMPFTDENVVRSIESQV